MKVALNSSEELVSINDKLPKDNYHCISCGQILIRKDKKEEPRERKKHFAHQGGNCTGSFETYLHKISKIIIAEHSSILLPTLGKIEYTEPRLEPKLFGIRPDAIIKTQKGEIVIEFYVTHRVSDENKILYQNVKVVAFEIDLSFLSYDSTLETITYAIIDDKTNKENIGFQETPKVNYNEGFITFLKIVGVGVFLFWAIKKYKVWANGKNKSHKKICHTVESQRYRKSTRLKSKF